MKYQRKKKTDPREKKKAKTNEKKNKNTLVKTIIVITKIRIIFLFNNLAFILMPIKSKQIHI